MNQFVMPVPVITFARIYLPGFKAENKRKLNIKKSVAVFFHNPYFWARKVTGSYTTIDGFPFNPEIVTKKRY